LSPAPPAPKSTTRSSWPTTTRPSSTHLTTYLVHDLGNFVLRQGQQATRLAVDRPNQHQVNYTTLPSFLAKQIEEDKGLFYKEKELLFVGRSNCGKSSVINTIFKGSPHSTKKKIARVSKRPGTTKFLHFHHILNFDAFLVDAPGYGYARMNKRRRELWFGLTEEYMKVSSRLSQIFVCINL
jgi:GTP-binding protein EngB required for normal cell division